jgi:hypothetical protein
MIEPESVTSHPEVPDARVMATIGLEAASDGEDHRMLKATAASVNGIAAEIRSHLEFKLGLETFPTAREREPATSSPMGRSELRSMKKFSVEGVGQNPAKGST